MIFFFSLAQVTPGDSGALSNILIYLRYYFNFEGWKKNFRVAAQAGQVSSPGTSLMFFGVVIIYKGLRQP
jgi:hypothetical protein